MGIMTTVLPVSKFGGFADFFNGVRADGTPMVFCFEELSEVVEHDVLVLLLCGESFVHNMPESVGMTTDDVASMEAAIANEINVAENEQRTQESIMEYKWLHGLD